MPIDLRRAEPGRRGVLGLATVVPLAILGIVAVLTETRTTRRLDQAVGDTGYSLGDPLVPALEVVALLTGNLAVTIALALMAVIAVARGERRIALWMVLSGGASLLGNVALKTLFARPRPAWDDPLHEIGGWSFPSGHSAGAGMLACVAVLLTIVLTGRGWRRRLLIALWTVLALGIAAHRVLLGVHYLTDVIAGLSFGIAVTVALWWALVDSDPGRRLPAQATATGSGGRRAAVVVNPSKLDDVAAFRPLVRQAADRHGWNPPDFYETTISDPGAGPTLAALESEVDLVIVAGGDGTVREVCHEAARTGVAVGIVPLGTGNLLARNLGLPLNHRDALDVAFGGQDKAIDLASVTTDDGRDSVFLVMAGVGMDAMIMDGVDDSLKRRVGWGAYFVSGFKALRFPGTRVEVAVDDGEPRRFRARTVVVGNVGFLQAGIPLLPQAEIDDGLLDVVVIAPRRFLGWLSIVWRVVTRRKATNEKLGRFTGRKVSVRTSSPTPMQLDGDPVGRGTEILAEVHSGVLLVRVPALPLPPGRR